MAIDKIVDPKVAAGAYSSSARIKPVSTQDIGGGPSFIQFLKEGVRDSIQTFKAGETMAARAVTEDADITDVVQAVNAAEITLQTVVALRDRLVGAYQELMRMPI
ncbi:MAG: flagellar hook-basal body complex protein FliE [Alphaproteobacteria bacterium]|nr:flagellar hook-basal body complex protein FliE [Alphaproteobacteria bacterium]